MKVVVIDGFVDEPAALGVRPYLHPMVRAMCGAAIDAGCEVSYHTIDEIRSGLDLTRADLYAIHAGSAVPGRYLRSMPASRKEVLSLIDGTRSSMLVGGPMALEGVDREGVILAPNDPAATIHDLLTEGKVTMRWRNIEEWNRWMLLGAPTVLEHPDFPDPLMVEVETYRGCLRHAGGGCSFCVEPLKGKPLFREVDDILEEIALLSEMGVHNFRLGAQTCFVSYKATVSRGEIVPDPESVEGLLKGISSLSPKVFHLDNANPAVIASRPEESAAILKSVVRHCTSGNVLALGMESADPAVIEANNLNSTPEQVLSAIEIINGIGGERGETGLPRLLPGLNLIVGLDGETNMSLDMNMEFLEDVLSRGLLLRRINIRQVMGIRRDFRPKVKRSRFLRFKEEVRERVDRPMLETMLPVGTVLKDVYMELRDGNRTFGRQVGSYPLLVGFNYPLEVERFLDAAVVGWGYRSLTAVEYPLPVNHCPMAALSSLPGVGRKRAMRLARARPLGGRVDLERALGDNTVAEGILGMIGFDLPGET